MPAGRFQVKLEGQWKDYGYEEDMLLKRAFLAGFPCASFYLRDQSYEYNFKRMEQKNMGTGKTREIRAPHTWKQPEHKLVASGPTTTVRVARGPGGRAPKSMCVPHPKRKGEIFVVNVPSGAKVGQVLLVPVPATGFRKGHGKSRSGSAEPSKDPVKEAYKRAEGGKGVSTGSAAFWGVGAAAVGAGAGVGGVLLGEHIAEEGWDAPFDTVGASLADMTGFAEDTGDFIVGAADDMGDFVMDLF